MIIEKASAAAMYGGSGSAVMFGMTPSEWSVIGVIVGIVIAVVGFAVNVWFKVQHLDLARRKAEADPEA
jgi:hypothetical protein